MKNFLKATLLLIFIVIIITSMASSLTSTDQNENILSTIERLENDINEHKILEDGLLNSVEKIDNESVNGLAYIFNKIGSAIVSFIAKILKFLANIITKFMI